MTKMKPLFAFKGAMTKTFIWSRKMKYPRDIPAYEEGELQIIFVKNSYIGRCLGNSQLDHGLLILPSLLRAGKKNSKSIERAHLKLALTAALKEYSHNRKDIVVHYSPLRGKHFEALGSRFRVLASAKGIDGQAESVVIDEALQFANRKHSFALISGRYPKEGLRFRVLLENKKSGPTVIYEDIVER